MIAPTEAELVRMLEVQACLPVRPPGEDWIFKVIERHPRHVFEVEFEASMLVADFGSWMEGARLDWPNVTEWALEARRFLASRFLNHTDTCSVREGGRPFSTHCTCGFDEARRLLGEPR